MFRISIFGVFGLCSVVAANAGQIQIGGVNGLTSSYVNSGVGAAGTYSEQNYDNVLFAGATNNSVAPTPYVGYTTAAASTGTLTDSTNNVTFSMINDGTTTSASNNFWASAQTACTVPTTCANPVMTIPIGIFGVSDVWTMINTELGAAGAKNLTMTFTFGASANATTGTQAITVKLNESTASNTPSGEITDSVQCSPQSSCSTLASGPTLTGPTIVSSVGVETGTVYSSTYNNGPLGSYGTSSGNLVLSDEGFFFNGISLNTVGTGDTNLNTYLVSVKVQQSGVVNGVSDALSAITVDTAAAPEPSTVLLILSGLGALGFVRFRKA